MHDVMISYSHKDHQQATMVLGILEKNGIKCWIDYRDALPGESYAGSIVRAIKSAKLLVVLLSSNSNTSGQVLNEINSAVNNGITIIPFKMDDAILSENMEYYLGKTHWLDALTPPIEAHVNKLVKIIQHYTENDKEKAVATSRTERDPATKKGCRMLKFNDLLELGYTPTTIALQLVENDYINCNGIDEANEGTAEQWEGFLQDNSETFQYLLDENNKIVGDWSIVALTDDAFERAERGDLLEAEIGIENTEMICFPNTYNGYILTFSLLPKHRNMTNYNLIIDSFLRQLEEYAENGIFFSRWCINVFGKEVEALVRQLGFQYVCNNKVLGKIYTCSFSPLPNMPLFKKYPKLMEYYENK